VRYDLDAVKAAISKDELASRTEGFWRYREFLPVRQAENRVSLGEVMTPLIRLTHTEKRAGVSGEIIVKDEGRLPTGSFKARGLCLAVSMAKEFGLKHLAMPTNGNAGSALAAYARAAGMRATVLCPDDTPRVNVEEIALQGAATYLVNGLITDCGTIVGEGRDAAGWFDVSTLKEPYRIEGKKTMGLELAEQLNWELPDAIFYPTGGGTGLIGMWKAFDELEAIGWIGSKRPKMIAVQAAGCAPIVKAFDAGEEHAPLWENAQTMAAGIRVPIAVGDFLILRAVRESGGFAIAVSDPAIVEARNEVAREEGAVGLAGVGVRSEAGGGFFTERKGPRQGVSCHRPEHHAGEPARQCTRGLQGQLDGRRGLGDGRHGRDKPKDDEQGERTTRKSALHRFS